MRRRFKRFEWGVVGLVKARLLRYNAYGSKRVYIALDAQRSTNVLVDNVPMIPDPTRSSAGFHAMTGAELAVALAALDVPFIAGASRQRLAAPPQPAVLLASLAASDEARLRLALIPLLLRRPEFARHAAAALRLMPPAAQTCFKCYYTAAMLLQEKHRSRLEMLLGRLDSLPDLFSTELRVPQPTDPDDALCILAARQRALTNRSINWLGTYEHGANRLLQALERREQWKV